VQKKMNNPTNNPNLTYCGQCGHLIAKTAPRCPGCGRPPKMADTAAPSPKHLVDLLPERLQTVLSEMLEPDEVVCVALKGAFKEALICTNKRVMILKTGIMTGHTFGSSVFQLPYRSITSAQVNKHMVTGYFEISAGECRIDLLAIGACRARKDKKTACR
jgi:Bacterial PH domain